MDKKHKTVFYFFLGIIAFVSCVVRSYRITGPIADWHSWRQADTAAVARNFLQFGIDPLHPRYDDLSNIQSGKDNPQGWRMVEFPLYQTIGAFLAHTFDHVSLEVWFRIVTITAVAGTNIFLCMIVEQKVDGL